MLNQDAISRRTFKYFKRTIFKQFKRSIQYSTDDKDNSLEYPKYDDLGRLIADNQNIDSKLDWQTIIEPIFPTSDRSTSQLLEGMGIFNNSAANQCSYMWFSVMDMEPKDTAVKVDGKIFKIAVKADYKHVFGFSIYYLRGRSDMNGLSEPDISKSTPDGTAAQDIE